MATEATPGPGSPPATAPTAPVPVLSPGHADQNHQSVPEQTGGPLVQAMPGEELDPGRHELAIPALGPDQEAAGDRQEKGSLHAQNAGTPDGAGGGLSRSCLGPEISGSLHKHSTDDSAMEAAVEPALQQALRPDADADTLSGMAPGRNHAEAPLDPTKQPCQDGPESSAEGSGERKGSGQIQREKQGPRYLTQEDHHELFYQMALLVLGNESNWCFANSMTYCLLWTLLCQHCPDLSQWGQHFESLHHFISTSSNQTCMLTDVSWFEQLLECWGRPQDQQDCGEFVHAALAWLASPAVNMGWERRWETSECVRCHDTGHPDMPLILQFTPELALHDTCTFQQLINTWHQAEGMRAALLQAPPVL